MVGKTAIFIWISKDRLKPGWKFPWLKWLASFSWLSWDSGKPAALQTPFQVTSDLQWSLCPHPSRPCASWMWSKTFLLGGAVGRVSFWIKRNQTIFHLWVTWWGIAKSQCWFNSVLLFVRLCLVFKSNSGQQARCPVRDNPYSDKRPSAAIPCQLNNTIWNLD